VSDAMGNIVKEGKTNTVDLSGSPSGVYVLELEDGRKPKLVKK
jgi:hypothetical protein